jgi:predicted Zn-ribbon and HTH transcriptional regulator
MDLDTVVGFGLTVRHILYIGGGLIALWIIVLIVKRLFAKPEDDRHLEKVRCNGCGWTGQVSRYAGRCPQCNLQLGEQMARKPS